MRYVFIRRYKMREVNTKQAVFLLFMVWILSFVAGASRAESWPKVIWNDLQENSSFNLGTNVAVGAAYDFTFRRVKVGVITSIYNWRKLHLEYGALKDKEDGSLPVTHSLGVSFRLRPFLKMNIPDKYVAVKNLHIGLACGYDLYHFSGLLQVHWPFGGLKKDEDPGQIARNIKLWGESWGD